MQVTGTIGDTTYTLTLSAGGAVEGPEFLVNAFKDVPEKDEEGLLRHARLLFGESMKVDRGEPAPAETGRPATDAERRMVAQGTPNQPDINVAAPQIQEHVEAEKAAEAPKPAPAQGRR